VTAGARNGRSWGVDDAEEENGGFFLFQEEGRRERRPV
jgi:hypothetical protein